MNEFPIRNEFRALLPDLLGIVEDASRATVADDRAIAREVPLFAEMLDSTIPYMSSMQRKNGWSKGKSQTTPKGQ